MKKQLDHSNSEKGFVLILLPFVLVIMLGALATVIDLTNLYSAKVKAENAVDLGILSAVQSFITEPSVAQREAFKSVQGGDPVTEAEKAYITSRFALSVRNNLESNGISLTPPTDKISLKTYLYNTDLASSVEFKSVGTAGNERARVTGEVQLIQPLFFGGVWKLLAKGVERSNDRKVIARSSSDLMGSNFVFILDLSSSMNCPSTTSCTCNTSARAAVGDCRQEANSSGNGRLKIEDIVQATKNVVASLDRGRDRLAIIIYNNAANVLVPFKDPGASLAPAGFDIDNVNNLLNRIVPFDQVTGPTSIFPNGNTNISDALTTARDEISRARLPFVASRNRNNVVLLTDGAPTAMRISLQNLRIAPVKNQLDVNRHPVGGNEFLAFQLTMQDPATNNFIQFMGPLVQTAQYKQMMSTFDGSKSFPITPASISGAAGYDDQMLFKCHLDNTGLAYKELFAAESTTRSKSYQNCISNWQPAWDNRMFGDGLFQGQNFKVDPSNTDPGSTNDFRKLFYLATIQAANSLAIQNVRLFTLSWGVRETPNATPTNIFTLNDVSSVKAEFLSNLANDPDSSFYEGDNKNLWDRSSESGELKDYFPNQHQGFSNKPGDAANGGAYIAISAAGMQSLFQKIIAQAKLAITSVSVPVDKSP